MPRDIADAVEQIEAGKKQQTLKCALYRMLDTGSLPDKEPVQCSGNPKIAPEAPMVIAIGFHHAGPSFQPTRTSVEQE